MASKALGSAATALARAAVAAAARARARGLALPGEGVGAYVPKRGFHRIGLPCAPTATRAPSAGPALGCFVAPARLSQIEAWLRGRWTRTLAARTFAPAATPTVNPSGLVAPRRGLKLIRPDRLAIAVRIDRVRQLGRLRRSRQDPHRLLDRLGRTFDKVPRLGWFGPAASKWSLG